MAIVYWHHHYEIAVLLFEVSLIRILNSIEGHISIDSFIIKVQKELQRNWQERRDFDVKKI